MPHSYDTSKEVQSNRKNEIGSWPTATMPLKKFCETFGYKADTMRARFRSGQAPQGAVYHIDPLGQYHIDLKGWDRWVTGNLAR